MADRYTTEDYERALRHPRAPRNQPIIADAIKIAANLMRPKLLESALSNGPLARKPEDKLLYAIRGPEPAELIRATMLGEDGRDYF